MKKTTIYLLLAVCMVVLFAAGAFGDDLKGTAGFNWQSWNTGDLNNNGAPYWDGTKYEGSQLSIGYYLTNTLVGVPIGPPPAAKAYGNINTTGTGCDPLLGWLL